MKYIKRLGLAAFAAMAFAAFVGASTASATTLDTFFISANACTGSQAHGVPSHQEKPA